MQKIVYQKPTLRNHPKNNQPKKYKQKQSFEYWGCRVCHNNTPSHIAYCLRCYHSPFYDYYVNTHLFVDSDEQSITQIGFDSGRKQEQLKNNEEGQQIVKINFRWIDTLLAGE